MVMVAFPPILANVKYQYPIPVGSAGWEAPSVSGNCIKGGRSGYSVKMVSRSFLELPDLPLGGGGETGPLRNPPSEFPSLLD